jgi:long-subunit acyl-CoA synthetase (AMP-forming)
LAVVVTGHPPQKAVDAALDAVNADLPFYRKLRRAILVDDVFNAESGMLTANQKLRRAVIEEHFKEQIDAVYEAAKAERDKSKRAEAQR